MTTQPAESIAEREIVIARTINAARERVWEAFTIEEQVVLWWGPDGFRNTNHEMDVRPGGVWSYTMHGPDGTNYPNRVRYIEVVPPERLVYLHDDGTDNPDEQFETTVTFMEREGKTVVTLRALFPTADVRRRHVEEYGAVEGGTQTLGRLARFLADEAPS
jgi:uncharacterized protein YndB with AHSA1/START domain